MTGNGAWKGSFAVKRMPTSWVTPGPQHFEDRHPMEMERPWHDIAILKFLNKLTCPFTVELFGVRTDDDSTYVIMSLATEFDLFTWCQESDELPRPGEDRERFIHPIAVQILHGFRWLHEVGVGHRDISLENILLTKTGSGELKVKIIDFGMASLSRTCHGELEVRGKLTYQAPEMHKEGIYDPFLSDSFSLGVVLYALAVEDNPWIATEPGKCKLFSYFQKSGFRDFVAWREVRLRPHMKVAEVLSEPFVALFDKLLSMDPTARLTLGESCYGAGRASVWDMEWLSSGHTEWVSSGARLAAIP
eukprot:gnl/TRDRNA2_/TRDRNA2_68648_c0_seq1.p1 gnl/TRDRNA2_/TRDRNA2_68648_c0~~gnl/TRDRNA2_/TRDRNA2_68648_c0_seq1.p1  ORF type:complete len:331 (+),score=49.84 gnl/TRDRNA2_/TRDRNA2_68648_c0_seq1:84-995(+)